MWRARQSFARCSECSNGSPSRATLASISHEVMGAVRERFAVAPLGAINITTDMWNQANTSWMAVTAHSITADWQMVEYLVGLVDTQSKTAEDQFAKAKHLINARLHAETTTFVATADNTASAKKLARLLSGSDDGNDKSVGCSCHLLNLVVRDALAQAQKDASEVAAMLERCRLLVTTVRRCELGSVLRRMQIADKVDVGHVRQLQLENDTRWHSMLYMVQSVLALNKYLAELHTDEELAHAPLAPAQMQTGTDLCAVLEFVRIASAYLEASQTPTMPLVVPVIVQLVDQLSLVVRDNLMRNDVVLFAKCLLKGVHDRFGDAIASPSWATVAAKLSPYHCDFQHTNVPVNAADVLVKQSLYLMPIPDSVAVDPEYADAHTGVNHTRKPAIIAGLNAIKLVFKSRRSQCGGKAFSLANINGEQELRFWRAVTDGDWDSIGEHSSEHRLALQTFAREYGVLIRAVLPIQASSAASERVFSEAGWLLSDGAGNLDMVEDTVRLRQLSRRSYADDRAKCATYIDELATSVILRRRK